MDISRYLRRIRYSRSVNCDLPTLRELQSRHVFAIPFENLDIQNGIPVLLHPESLYQKVVLDRRGGYCYELNLLFQHLLTAYGFSVALIAGRLFHGHEFGA